ncbi:hypothetical protein [Microbacterium capsulatum]|uniref:PH domain-containing protein n=1 Tax=Microbacterium capsulatum TaxID=3041921 RepID=A0ABU0XJF0_9MICO|nr:hypothetical protein [Microbacterium sp. ASV81]MDQ4215251.1 hypothetical protein [Microbacterium sp. ASV81]
MMGTVAVGGLTCLYVALFQTPDSMPWQLALIGLLLLAGAALQLWQWGFLSINASRMVRQERPIAWALIRTGYIESDDVVIQFLRPGWIFVFHDRVDIFDVRYAMTPRSPSRNVLSLEAADIREVSISRRFRLSYDHIFVDLADGRTVEIEITPKNGWTVRGARREELEEVASAIKEVAGGSRGRVGSS